MAEEVFEAINELSELLQDEFGDDPEMKVIVLSFLMGRNLRDSKIGIEKAFAMASSAKELEL